MKPKTIKITYWIITILFAAFFIMDGIASVLQVQSGKEIILALGFPLYFMTINGVAKVLGAIALLQTKWSTLKEWAYAGFAINMIGAGASNFYAGMGAVGVIFPALFLAIMFASYALWKKHENNKKVGLR